jgi:hypothetical protein
MRGVSRAGSLGLALLMLVLFEARPAFAYAWMIKYGFAKCQSCHVDPSGGETLTLMGRMAAGRYLALERADGDEPIDRFLFGFGLVREPEPVRLGGSYRHMFIESDPFGDGSFDHFPMQLDVYGTATASWFVAGGSLGVARGIEGSAHVRAAQLNRELGTGWISLSRTHFVGAYLDRRTLLRAGRLNLPFGIRMPEHVAWAREATRTDRESDQQHGVTVAYNRERWRGEAMLIVGNYQIYPDRYRERGYSLSVEYLATEEVALGLSSLVTFANEDRFTLERRAVRHAHGLSGRFAISDRWALLAELDALKQGERSLGYVGWVQADYEPWRGLHALLTAELLDQGEPSAGPSSPGNGEARSGFWMSLAGYAFAHLELRLDAIVRQQTPFSLQAQLHLFL